ncbi:MAG: NADH-quinone oxidoreductase subunit J [Candidatus Omnitrophica bacterium]|nr:NADH-quinone oxidoreductase subunit J [Candidatus Omnitrophota bacterium]
MSPLVLLVKTGIYLLMALSLLAAVGVVTFRNIFHSALALAGTLLGVAGIYLALRADFLAGVQILLYVGAVVTLILFAIMLTHRLGDPTIPQANKQSGPALAGLLILAALLGSLFLKTNWPVSEAALTPVTVRVLAKALLGEFVFPFEVVSIVLLAALIGAIVIARKD